MEKDRYVNVDELQAQTTLHEAAAMCGATIDVHGASRQVRLDCPFGCPGEHAGRRELSIDSGNPQKVFACHAYGCQMRGNLLTLMHGWLTGTRPTGDKLKGAEFSRVRGVLAGGAAPLSSTGSDEKMGTSAAEKSEPQRNIPLALHEKEQVREMVTLDEKFLIDVAHMPPAAASYVRRHPCLTPTAMQKWRAGVLPQDGGSDKRGWSYRGQMMYALLSEDGKLLGFVSRDPQWEAKEQAWKELTVEQRAKEKAPHKHRFPPGLHRGIELYGQHASRLDEPGFRELIARTGIIVVEGFNDVIGLDSLGIPAVAIMSNVIADEQVPKIERFAKKLASGKVTLLFDVDDKGQDGVKESLWRLAQRGLDVRLGWSKTMHGGKFSGRQPENLTLDEWQRFILPAIVR